MLIAWLSILIAVLGLGLAGFWTSKIMKQKVADRGAAIIADYIKNGVIAFLTKQYRLLAIVSMAIALIIFFIPALSWRPATVFLVGVLFSVATGSVMMWLSTLSNVRTAEKLKDGWRAGLSFAYSVSSINGILMAGLGIFGVGIIYLIFRDYLMLYSFCFGASLAALFFRVGGGIYTKAADIGSDLVGKVEKDIPEDDPRNPASIADNVGDNVGDLAGLSSDLFESYANSIIAAMVFGSLLLPFFGSWAAVLPLLLAVVGLAAFMVAGLAFKYLKLNPRKILNSIVLITAVLFLIGSFFTVKYTIGDLRVFTAVLVGLISGLAVYFSTEYYVSAKNRPVREVADAAKTGSATNIMSGLSLGFFSTIIPVAVLITLLLSANYFAGSYGIAMAIVGMLAIISAIMAANSYGPIVDNAKGIAQMAGLGSEIRERADNLDLTGNTASAVAKGFAAFSAALISLILFFSFIQIVALDSVNLMDIKIIIGLFIGGLLPFIFSAMMMKSVSRAVAKMVIEIRRQFKSIEGLMSGQVKPDYKKCVEIATESSLKQMIPPGLIALIMPIAVGWFWGVASLAGLLLGSILVSFLLSLFLTNSGGALDNAKKYIEADHLGGQDAGAYESATIGDTVGDPLKDVVGPALNVLVKLMAITAVMIAPLLML